MLSGCNSLPILKETPATPPAEFMQDRPEPVVQQPLTNGALGQYAIDAREVIRLSNTDKASIREWAARLKEQHGSIK